jgi:hypothetical protein
MSNLMRVTSTFAAALALAACGRTSSVDEQMKLDLQAASAATPELAPRSGGTRVVSAVEQTSATQPLRTTTRQVRTSPVPAAGERTTHGNRAARTLRDASGRRAAARESPAAGRLQVRRRSHS